MPRAPTELSLPNPRKRLWLFGASVALFVLTLLIGNAFVAPDRALNSRMLGHDFVPFYAAGQLVREGHHHDLYDLHALRAAEQRIARDAGIELDNGFGPFWNPPFYALPFAALSTLPYRFALLVWTLLNFGALTAAVLLLRRLLPLDADWRTWGLIPLFLLVSMPLIQALTHGQNTFGSLLLLCVVVAAWRARRATLAGAILGLLAYKPQLAAIVALVLVIDLGWKALAGMAVAGAALLLITLIALPGAVTDYATRLPSILHFMQVENPYLWERHATLRAFWRLLIQGHATGEVSMTVQVLTAIIAGVLLLALLAAAVRVRRHNAESLVPRDRLIAATVVSMPLVMPFYFDYDLLLLAVPAVLFASERVRRQDESPAGIDRWIPRLAALLFVWLMVNPDFALMTRVNGAIVLISGLAATLVRRVFVTQPSPAITESSASSEPGARLAA